MEKALAARYEAGIKIRQPIAALKIKSQMANLKDKEELLNLIKDEVNVKEILFVYNLESEVEIDTVISERLKKEGQVREIIRQINNFRKESKLTIHDEVILYQEGFDDLFSEFGDEIKKATLVKEVKAGRVDLSKKVEGGIIGIEKS
ncbi:hypothetical protein HYZ76_01975 [Candidatus Falkowbacteria bacterium]|nr:hypothetical protein [Candidatus Falkowbacteria bacterium]